MKTTTTIVVGDCRDRIKDLDEGSVHCVVTSPPYFQLRDYGCDGQIGLESTVDEYLAVLVSVFRECRRALRDDGTLWINLADKYHPKLRRLIVPHRLAIALVADGWYLQDEVIWHKPAVIPQAVVNRTTQSHELVFLLTKKPRGYYTDRIERQEPAATNWIDRGGSILNDTGWSRGAGTQSHLRGNGPAGGVSTRNRRSVWSIPTEPCNEQHFAMMPSRLAELCIAMGAPTGGVCSRCGSPLLRSVDTRTVERPRPNRLTKRTGDRWQGRACRNDIAGAEVVDLGFSPACSCSADVVAGTVLDPFVGAATTLIAASRRGLNGIGIELNDEYAAIAQRRFNRVAAGLFSSPAVIQRGG